MCPFSKFTFDFNSFHLKKLKIQYLIWFLYWLAGENLVVNETKECLCLGTLFLFKQSSVSVEELSV